MRQVWAKAGAGELEVLKTGTQTAASSATASVSMSVLPPQDASARTLGVLSAALPTKVGTDTHAMDATQRRSGRAHAGISHVRNLLEPPQVDTRVPLDATAATPGDTLESASEIIIMAILRRFPTR